MKKTVAVLLLTILTIALLLCGCDANLQKEGTPIIKKTEIREGDKSVTVVYEDGYELSYLFTQPIETFVEKDVTRTARAIGSAYAYYVDFTQSTNPFASVAGAEDYYTSVDGEGNIVVSGEAFIGNASMSELQTQSNKVERYFEKDGKKYVDYSVDLLTIFHQKTKLIDFATGYEEEPYDNISDFGFRKFEALEAVILPVSIKKVGKKAFEDCPQLTTVYYFGTEIEWQSVELVAAETKTNDEDKNETVEVIENDLARCTVYFYSEDPPTATGNYWHFVNGVPVAW